MCQPDPVRTVLDRLSLEQVQSALGSAQHRLQAARKTGDSDSAEILSRVVSSFEDEVRGRLAVIVARGIVRESQEAERQAREPLNQAMNG
jgi:uncharacterized protein YciW